jgi:hypothetical protein
MVVEEGGLGPAVHHVGPEGDDLSSFRAAPGGGDDQGVEEAPVDRPADSARFGDGDGRWPKFSPPSFSKALIMAP